MSKKLDLVQCLKDPCITKVPDNEEAAFKEKMQNRIDNYSTLAMSDKEIFLSLITDLERELGGKYTKQINTSRFNGMVDFDLGETYQQLKFYGTPYNIEIFYSIKDSHLQSLRYGSESPEKFYKTNSHNSFNASFENGECKSAQYLYTFNDNGKRVLRFENYAPCAAEWPYHYNDREMYNPELVKEGLSMQGMNILSSIEDRTNGFSDTISH